MNDFGLFILRAAAMKYGLPKLRDVEGSFTKDFESLGFHPARRYVKQAGLVELILLGCGSAAPSLLPFLNIGFVLALLMRQGSSEARLTERPLST